jgi:uncharacterized membrane protein
VPLRDPFEKARERATKIVEDTQKTSTGLDANVAAALSYGLGWITGVVFLLIEQENAFVRFHAMQSAIVFGTLSLAWFVLVSIPFVGWLLAIFVLIPASAILWLLLLFKAYQGERFKVPIAGDMAEQRI